MRPWSLRARGKSGAKEMIDLPGRGPAPRRRSKGGQLRGLRGHAHFFKGEQALGVAGAQPPVQTALA